MGFDYVAFLPSLASFSTTFRKDCGRGEGLGITTCPKCVVLGKHGHAPCKMLLLQQSLFLCRLNFMEITITVINFGRIWPPSVLGIIPDYRQWCLSICL